jgi:hypothetical protein
MRRARGHDLRGTEREDGERDDERHAQRDAGADRVTAERHQEQLLPDPLVPVVVEPAVALLRCGDRLADAGERDGDQLDHRDGDHDERGGDEAGREQPQQHVGQRRHSPPCDLEHAPPGVDARRDDDHVPPEAVAIGIRHGIEHAPHAGGDRDDQDDEVRAAQQ